MTNVEVLIHFHHTINAAISFTLNLILNFCVIRRNVEGQEDDKAMIYKLYSNQISILNHDMSKLATKE